MQEFLLLFRNVSGNGQYISTPQDMQQDMPKWQAWIGNLAAQGKLVDTRPVDYAGAVISRSDKNDEPYKSENILVAGYLICKAENLEEVMAYAQSCPILRYEQGSVEIRSISAFEM